ncbi:hypothetical protein [Mesorhizobium sp. M0276]|uniref:hypothetical protein n=1 Tax=Mesorhizobium sp. M0276 TaxID=2956928 RepID=UPI003334CBE8
MQNIVDAGSEHETVHLSAIWNAGLVGQGSKKDRIYSVINTEEPVSSFFHTPCDDWLAQPRVATFASPTVACIKSATTGFLNATKGSGRYALRLFLSRGGRPLFKKPYRYGRTRRLRSAIIWNTWQERTFSAAS